MRLLVFDDDAAIGRLVVRMATAGGVDATAVTNAEDFAKELDAEQPRIVVLDLQLRDTDGVEQMRLLAERQYSGSLILMSGFDQRVLGTVEALGKSLGLKVEGILEKPLRAKEFNVILERLLAVGETPSVERLLAAIINDELALDLQPVVTRNPPKLRKLEVLVRWEHPSAGRIPPGEFLSVAESDVACIDALTEWVLGAAVEAYQVLREVGIIVPLSVNISSQNLHDLTFPDRIEKRLRDGDMPAHHLCLEVTETAAFHDTDRTMDILSPIRLKGMSLSIDDFGVGFSSLKLLRQMPFSEIKIDQSFIGDALKSRDSRMIAKSIMDLAANMEMHCVAEGIETKEIMDVVEQLGTCALQGYYIGRPMPVEALAVWLKHWTRAGGEAPLEHEQMAADASVVTAKAPEQPGDVIKTAPGGPANQFNDAVARLSPRQLEVMELLSKGLSVKEIARHLELGLGTVKVHLSQAYSSLGARNRIEAVTRAGLYR